MLDLTTKNKTLRLALCGMGAAGRARLNALEEVPGLELAGTISRRPECATLAWEQALRDPGVAAVAISTENTDHPARVEAALEAGKHVLCDYPLAADAERGRALFQLAKEKHRVLHVEHIGLLAEEHLELRQRSRTLGPLKTGDYLFQGGWNEKLADAARSGPIPLLALPRLLQIADLFGPFRLESHRLERDAAGFSLHLHLKFPEGGVLGFTEERRGSLPRRRSFLAECAGGPLAWRSGSMSGGLFARDLEWFRDRIFTEKPCYYDENTMLEIIGLLAGIS